MTTFSDLVGEAWKQVQQDTRTAGLPEIEGASYADAVATYLAFGLSRLMSQSSTICPWSSNPAHELVITMFSRQAIPMTWDFGEINPFCQAASWEKNLSFIPKAIEKLDLSSRLIAEVYQADAVSSIGPNDFNNVKVCVSTDPPYYDNIGYADLSDFFYIWLRRSLNNLYPDLFKTILVPKSQELIAASFRFGGDKKKAQKFFEEGLGMAFQQIYKKVHPNYPLTIYYAFRQSEVATEEDDLGSMTVTSTGWETMLEALVHAGFVITGTWPIRTERPTGMKVATNALASSIVLVCRPRPEDAPVTIRREFLRLLKQELPAALRDLQRGNIAPVDLAQASIGPGMAIFSRHKQVLEADGSAMRVRTALALINQALDEYLAEQEGEYEADTRWALAWYEQYAFNEGPFGDAETLSKAKNTSTGGMVEAGILAARGGKVRLLRRDELRENWDPAQDVRLTVWEIVQQLIQALDKRGETGAAELLNRIPAGPAEAARDLAYRLYSLCERKGWAAEALPYNGLVVAWPEVARLVGELRRSQPGQGRLI